MQQKFEWDQILGGSLLIKDVLADGTMHISWVTYFVEGKLFSGVFVYILTIECRNKNGSKDERRAMFIADANGGNSL